MHSSSADDDAGSELVRKLCHTQQFGHVCLSVWLADGRQGYRAGFRVHAAVALGSQPEKAMW